MVASLHANEVFQGERFEFGANWASFLNVLTEENIIEAEKSFREMIGITVLTGKTFLDIGSGSGLSSLVARRLEARVHSFDYDPKSFACTKELKRRYFADDADWIVEEGSVLDQAYLKRLGGFDFVYSWGVLHHTGQMWKALENAASLVKQDGKLFVAIYNDQGRASNWWKVVKRIYCSGLPGRTLMKAVYFPYFGLGRLVLDIISLRNPIARYREYSRLRGMSAWHDVVDWIGGYPFEVAKPEEIFKFFKQRGFVLDNLKTCAGGLGCNEFVFTRSSI
jgi:2-polyprenyl-6-hydroxyphenyl methylase/3-demethylubiquinone-9 3-methyltransferase